MSKDKKHHVQITIKIFNDGEDYKVSEKVHNFKTLDYKKQLLYLESLIEKLSKQNN